MISPGDGVNVSYYYEIPPRRLVLAFRIQDNHRQKLRAEAVCEIEDAAKLHEKNGSDVPEAVHAKAEVVRRL